MVRKSQRHKADRRERKGLGVFHRTELDRKRGILLQRQVTAGPDGRVASYSLVYIDPTVCAADHGRVLGYDNEHGFHHRHYMGMVEPIEFESFEALERRFEQEFWEIYHAHHGRGRDRKR